MVHSHSLVGQPRGFYFLIACAVPIHQSLVIRSVITGVNAPLQSLKEAVNRAIQLPLLAEL